MRGSVTSGGKLAFSLERCKNTRLNILVHSQIFQGISHFGRNKSRRLMRCFLSRDIFSRASRAYITPVQRWLMPLCLKSLSLEIPQRFCGYLTRLHILYWGRYLRFERHLSNLRKHAFMHKFFLNHWWFIPLQKHMQRCRNFANKSPWNLKRSIANINCLSTKRPLKSIPRKPQIKPAY